MDVERYFTDLGKDIERVYGAASEARARGLDPVKNVEIPLATSLAARAVGLISTIYPQINTPQLIQRIIELEDIYGKLDPAICLKIGEEIAQMKFCQFESNLQAIDAGIRIGIAYITLGVVSSPIEGFTELKVKKRRDGGDFFSAYYAGPIRSAGGTGAAFSLVIVDYLREFFGFSRYDPDEKEVKRAVIEMYDYHERITNLQYLPSEKEALFLFAHLPVQVTGDPSEDKEVSNYKDLDRVETNFIRSGFCLTFAEGMAQKAPKILKMIKKLREKGFKLSDWDFLEEFVILQGKLKEEKKKEASAIYIQDIVAGRPVLGHPGKSGSFRLRYGRCRGSGYSALAIHPATMFMMDSFIAIGGQLKIEKPTKGASTSVCDSIDGPIVRLMNGGVRRVQEVEEAKHLYKQVSEILYLGDLLVPYGDFANRNHFLLPAGYVEEWWERDMEKAGGEFWKQELYSDMLGGIFSKVNIDFAKAIALSVKYRVPLHPSFIYFWSQLSYDEFIALLDWMGHGLIHGKLLLPYNRTERERFKIGKRALEILGVPHEVAIEHVLLDEETSKAFLTNLGISAELVQSQNFSLDGVVHEVARQVNELSGLIDARLASEHKKLDEGRKVLEIVNGLSKYVVRDKAGTFIGARMGRPEKAKLRKLVGSPHTLFPVGDEGGRMRSLQEAIAVGHVKGDFPLFYCDSCQKEEIYRVCESCGKVCRQLYHCDFCQTHVERKCEAHGRGQKYSTRRIDIKPYFQSAIRKLHLEKIPELVKGVRGTSSRDHLTEHLCKGLLRANYGLHVNKDGTIRFDATELPLTHFKPLEIGVSIEKLKELGYERDVHGKLLEREDQILELMPHDILLPSCPETLDEKADDVFLKIMGFVDSLLERFYGLPTFYHARSRDDLVGHLVACIAPHNCASVVGRILGFSKTQALLASPYMHAAMRRDCLGYDNYVAVQRNGRWSIEKIGDFVAQCNPQECVDIFGTRRKEMSGLCTWSNPGASIVKEVTQHQPRRMLKLFLEDGRGLELTEDHRVYVKGKQEKRACELQEGDQLMVSYQREIEEKDLDELFLPEIFAGRSDVMLRNVREYLSNFEGMKKHDNFYQRDSYPLVFVQQFLHKYQKTLLDLPSSVRIAVKRDDVEIPLRIPLDREFLEVMGLYIAEGYLRKKDSGKGFYQVAIAGNEEIKSFIKKVFLSHLYLKPSYENSDQVVYSSRLVHDLFVFLGVGAGARTKRIPSLFLDLKKEKLAALLRGYFEGDGSVSLSDVRVCCDTVSGGLRSDLSFVLSRFGIFTKFYEYSKEPGPKVKAFYVRKQRPVPVFTITKVIIPSNFVRKFRAIGFLSSRKNAVLEEICKKKPYGMKIDFDESYVYPKVLRIEEKGEDLSYCFTVDSEHNFFANDILVHNCDGDEAAVMLLLDMLLNFSRAFLPAHRGGTQDTPLVLNSRIRAGEVDDMIFDFDVSWKIPLELYGVAERGEHPSQVKMEQIKDRIGKEEFQSLGYTHEVGDMNYGVLCSSYKKLATMQEKVQREMELVEKIRAVLTGDVARLIIERHFIRDIRGNLRKFSSQEFRCVKCNEKYRRPPLAGNCLKCQGRIIFTISEGSIIKYLEPAIALATKYEVPVYIRQSLELTKSYIESIFGREKEKQEGLGKWF